ncbi:sensor domain-containing diguanylate cyclase [Actinoplanes sp. NPDC049802]|uniref:sensor domain-containing diguanylate cyclase n=1 Tax=Actinoplanes sp. NPDC049802 TaxID=3154742 RepID=UPI0033C501F8
MRFRTPTPALAGYFLVTVWFVLHLLNVGGWEFQSAAYKIFAPLLSAVPASLAWRAWRAARRAGLRGARRHLLLTTLGWSCMTASALVRIGDPAYPSTSPVALALDLVVTVLILAALLLTPVVNRWSASRLRLGLDMATVLLAGAAFLWYFLVYPAVEAGADAAEPTVVLVRTTGVLIALFAVTRLWLGGVAEISRRAMRFAVVGAVAQTAVNVMQQTLPVEHLHFALAARQIFIGILIAASVAHLRKITHGEDSGAGARGPSSLTPYAAVAAVDALLVGALLTGGLDLGAWVVLGAAMTLTTLVVARQVVGLRDNTRLVVRVDAGMRALRESMAREQLLSDLGTALLRTTDAAQVHRLAADAAATLLDGCANARTSVVTVSPDGVVWTVVHASGAGAEALLGVELPGAMVPSGLAARVARGEVVTAPGWSGLGVAGLDAFDHRPIMLLPLLNGDRFFGVLTVGTDEELPADVMKALQTLRTQVSLALDSVALTAELTVRAMHDMLTGLGNRALLRDRLTGALARSRRTVRPVGVLLLDLNGFKPVNDTYGHDAGDTLLKVVAERLKTCVRTEDMVARLGGDEFVVVAEDLREPADALRIAERIVTALDEAVPVGGHLLRTPASIGIALSEPGDSPDDVLRYADAAMYTAKRLGGGRFHVHGEAAVSA